MPFLLGLEAFARAVQLTRSFPHTDRFKKGDSPNSVLPRRYASSPVFPGSAHVKKDSPTWNQKKKQDRS